MNFTIELDQETDGRIIAEIPDLPGVLVYGESKDQAIALAKSACLARSGGSSGAWRNRSGNGECLFGRRMSVWSSVKARRVLSALLKIGWRIKRKRGGSHKVLRCSLTGLGMTI